MNLRVSTRYLLGSGIDPPRVAELVAGEQWSGTFVVVPGETAELRERYRARGERLAVVGPVDRPSLAAARPVADGICRRCLLELSWPLDNRGPSLPDPLATGAGHRSELPAIPGLELRDRELPDAVAAHCPGPRFAIEGTRRLAAVAMPPLIGTIVEPSVGLSPEATAELVDQLCPAGIDFTRDGELLADGPHRPFEARARPVSPVLREHAERLGRLPMSAPNLTGEIDDMRRRHDLVPALGGSCAMVSLDSVGLVGFPEVGRRSRLPLHARRNGSGYLSRRPRLGWDCRAWSKIGWLGDARGARGCLGRRAGATGDRLRARPGSARALCPMRGDRAHPLSTGKPDPAHDPRAGAVRERGCRLRDGAARSDRGSEPPRRIRAALVDGMLGHRSIELGIPFGAFPGRFSGGAFLAVEPTKTPILRPDWRERVFAARPVRQSAIEICNPGG